MAGCQRTSSMARLQGAKEDQGVPGSASLMSAGETSAHATSPWQIGQSWLRTEAPGDTVSTGAWKLRTRQEVSVRRKREPARDQLPWCRTHNTCAAHVAGIA